MVLFELDKCISSLKLKKVRGEVNINVKNIAYDSRKVKPGSLFVCIKGFKTDGHLYAENAIKSGASAIVTERWLNLSSVIPQIQVLNTREALAVLSNTLFVNPTSELQLVGITGTNGKTTTSYLVDSMFRTAGKKTGLTGTVQCKIGDRVLAVDKTTPESYDLQRLFRDMVNDEVSCATMEISSHGIDLHRIDGCHFNALVFTNLSQDHLDYHRSMDDYFKTKKKLFDDNDDVVRVINVDDSYGRQIVSQGGKIFCYGLTQPADIRAEDLKINREGSMFKVLTSTLTLDLSIKLRGLFNVYNSLAAVGVGLALGLSPEHIKVGIESVSTIPGRFEAIDCGQDFSVFVDYAHTPDGLEKLISAAREITENRVITLFGCGGDRDKKKRPLMGAIAGKLSNFTIITSDNPRSEEPKKIIKEIEGGLLKETPNANYRIIIDRKEAIYHAISSAKVGDVVLVAGKGHEKGQIFGDKTVPFDDRVIVREALRELTLCSK